MHAIAIQSSAGTFAPTSAPTSIPACPAAAITTTVHEPSRGFQTRLRVPRPLLDATQKL